MGLDRCERVVTLGFCLCALGFVIEAVTVQTSEDARAFVTPAVLTAHAALLATQSFGMAWMTHAMRRHRQKRILLNETFTPSIASIAY